MRRRTGRPASRAFVVAVVLLAAFSQAPAMAPDAQSPSERRAEPAGLIDLGLEELLNLEVTSVSKKRQPLSLTAAAVHVITAEDIR